MSRFSRTTTSTTPAPFTLESPNAAHPSCPAAPNARRTLAPARNLAPKKLAFVGRCAKMRACFFSVIVRSKSGAPRWARPSNFLSGILRLLRWPAAPPAAYRGQGPQPRRLDLPRDMGARRHGDHLPRRLSERAVVCRPRQARRQRSRRDRAAPGMEALRPLHRRPPRRAGERWISFVPTGLGRGDGGAFRR
jgi:hypothetical protein